MRFNEINDLFKKADAEELGLGKSTNPMVNHRLYLEYIWMCLKNPEQQFVLWMFGETTISHVKILVHHTIKTTIKKWLFGVPGIYLCVFVFP